MRARLLSRYDTLLLAGLTGALIVVFARPIRFVLDTARAVEDASGLSLLPALVILTVVFTFQQHAKRQEAAARAAAATVEATVMRERLHELEELVNIGRSLAEVLDLDALREALWRHLPLLTQSRQVWLLLRDGDRWTPLLGVARRPGEPAANGELDAVAARIASQDAAETRLRGVEVAGYIGFPLVFGGRVIGVLGVVQGARPLDESERRRLAAAAPLVAIAVKNAQLFVGLRDVTIHDSLTGCFTRRHALALLDTELRRAERSGLPLSVLMLDIDHFKAVNDRYGHLAGDAVLRAVGRQLRETLRASDIPCRYGGEEFLVVLPDTPPGGAARLAESLRQAFEQTPIRWEREHFTVTASVGVAAARTGERSPETLLARADRALYEAKQAGRNCVRAFGDASRQPGGTGRQLTLSVVAAPHP